MIVSNMEREEKIKVDFEFHPPIEDDSQAITNFIRQNFKSLLNCELLAKQVVDLKDTTLVLTMDDSDHLYGVCSLITSCDDKTFKFFKEKLPTLDNQPGVKVAFLINERYINLPPQLSLPFFRTVQSFIDREKLTHLICISKILLKTKATEDEPNKKSSTKMTEDIIFMNPEEEILSDYAETFIDIGVTDEEDNSNWFMGCDAKYAPHRRVLLLGSGKWAGILRDIEKELE